MGKLGIFLLVGFVVLVILGVAVLVPALQARAEIDSLIQQTQVAASLGEISDSLTDVIGAMEQQGATSGYSSLIDRVPANDIGLDYQALIRIRDRAEQLRNEDVFSTTYNVALDDIRGTLREIDVNVFWWYMWKDALGVTFVVLLIIWVIAALIGIAVITA